MQHIYDLDVPQTLEEACDPRVTALLVYDMQVGVLGQLPNAPQIIPQVVRVLEAARSAGLRVFFTRHMSLPKEVMGVTQMRTAMAWQQTSAADVTPWFLPDTTGFALVPEVAPLAREAVADKITMSAFEGTFLNIALRDCGIRTVIIVGVALEVGIEPTARHAADLGYIPVVVADACGGRDEEARQRSLAGLAFAGDAILTDVAAICRVLGTAA